MERTQQMVSETELTGAEASNVLMGAFAKVKARIESQPNYLAIANAAGDCLRLTYKPVPACSDLWAAYDRLHLALGLPMDWRGPAAMSTHDLTNMVGYILRSLDTPDALMAIAHADKSFRLARREYLKTLSRSAEAIEKQIAANRYEQSSYGAASRHGDIQRLAETRAEIRTERAVLFQQSDYIEFEGVKIPVVIDGDDTGWTVTAADGQPLIKHCTDGAWSVEHSGYCNEQKTLVCDCGAEFPVKFGVIAEGK